MSFTAMSTPTPGGVTRVDLVGYVDPIDPAVGAADVDSVRDAIEGHIPELHGAGGRRNGLVPAALVSRPRVQLINDALAHPDPQSSGAVVHRCPHVHIRIQIPDLIELPQRAGELD